MAATLMAVNERAHVDLGDIDLGAEPAVLGATDCPFFTGPGGERFTVATSLVGSLTFRSYLAAMRRADLSKDPRFTPAAARRQNLDELHQPTAMMPLSARSLDAYIPHVNRAPQLELRRHS